MKPHCVSRWTVYILQQLVFYNMTLCSLWFLYLKEEPAASIFREYGSSSFHRRRLRQKVPPKPYNLPTKLHGVTSQKAVAVTTNHSIITTSSSTSGSNIKFVVSGLYVCIFVLFSNKERSRVMSVMHKYKDNIIITYSVLQQVHSLFQSDYSRECDIVFPISISSTFSFP